MALCFPPQNEIDNFRVKLTEGESFLLQNLQNYLDEFTYKLNRRNFKSTFERLAVAGASNYCYNCD